MPHERHTDKEDYEILYSLKAQTTQTELQSINQAAYMPISQRGLQRVCENTLQDNELLELISIILEGWPDTQEKAPVSTGDCWNYRDDLSVQDGIIFKGQQILIPKTMRKDVLSKIHCSHSRIEGCLRKARGVIFWPNIAKHIRDLVSNCDMCAEFQANQQKEPLVIHSIPNRPRSKVLMDLFTENGHNYLILVDDYSDFWEMDKQPDTTSATVIERIMKHFSRLGRPDCVFSDGGPQSTFKEFARFSKDWEFHHITSSPYNSQSNGKAESAVKIAKALLKKMARNKENIWQAILEWRNTPTAGMTSSPVQRLMSRCTQSWIPTSPVLLKPKVATKVPDKLQHKRTNDKTYYDRDAKEILYMSSYFLVTSHVPGQNEHALDK